jgi:chaperonin GroES
LQSALIRRLIPLGDRILVRRIEAATKTTGGVFLPDATLKKANEGEVVEVGEGFRTEAGTVLPVNVAIGDKVLLPEYGGTAVSVGDEDMFLFRDSDLLGKFD